MSTQPVCRCATPNRRVAAGRGLVCFECGGDVKAQKSAEATEKRDNIGSDDELRRQLRAFDRAYRSLKLALKDSGIDLKSE